MFAGVYELFIKQGEYASELIMMRFWRLSGTNDVKYHNHMIPFGLTLSHL